MEKIAEIRSVLREIPVGKDPNWVDVTPDGKIVVVSNTASDDVSIINVETRKVIRNVPVGKAPKRLALGSILIQKPGLKP